MAYELAVAMAGMGDKKEGLKILESSARSQRCECRPVAKTSWDPGIRTGKNRGRFESFGRGNSVTAR